MDDLDTGTAGLGKGKGTDTNHMEDIHNGSL